MSVFEMDKISQIILWPKVLILSRSILLVSCWSLGRLHKGQWHRAGYIIQVDMARGSGEIWKIQHHTNYTFDAWSGQVYQHSGLNKVVDIVQRRFWMHFLEENLHILIQILLEFVLIVNKSVSIGSGGG